MHMVLTVHVNLQNGKVSACACYNGLRPVPYRNDISSPTYLNTLSVIIQW